MSLIDLPPKPEIWLPPKPAIIRPADDLATDKASVGAILLGARRAVMGTPYRYFRLDVTAIDGGAQLQIAELKYFEGAVDNPTSAMTGNTAPIPFVASASTEGKAAYFGFDNTIGDGFQWETSSGTTGWLQIDLGSGNGIVVSSFKITARVGNRTPKDFTLEGSNAGTFSGEEVVLKTVTGETGWSLNEERTYTVP